MTDLRELAAEAYVYGYPLVSHIDAVDRFTREGLGPVVAAAPFNEFSHGSRPAGADDTSAGAVGGDTLCSIAQLDLSGGALLLTVPDTAGRYYVLQFVDAWTNNFAYVGRRATGTGAASFLLTPPGWDEPVPAGATRISVPTMAASIVGRWACAGPEDVAAVRELQEETLLEPYWTASGEPMGLPTHAYTPEGEPELLFFEKLRARMAAFPPAAPDVAYQQRFAPLGLLDPESPYARVAPEVADALRAGFAAGEERVERAVDDVERMDGWRLGYHAFDFNADFFEVGTLKDPQWVYADRELGRTVRAGAARAALWGSHGYEVACAMAWTDEDGEPLDGSRPCTLTFEKPPPVDASWSVMAYALPEARLAAHPLDRYVIGDGTPGLAYGDDGSLTLCLQAERPADDKAAANWLPVPEGLFQVVLRMYTPRAAVFDGTYQLPPVRRV